MGLMYFDIETLPSRDPKTIEKIKEKMNPPGNMSKPETIQKWRDDPANLEAEVAKTSFSAALGNLFCIGYAIDDDAPQVICDDDQKIMVDQFVEVVRNKGRQHDLVGHNIKGFDIPYMSQKMMIHGHAPLFSFFAKPWEQKSHDTMEMWSCGNYRNKASLDVLCGAFGVPTPKDGIDGSEVHAYWLDGRHTEILEYCMRDVEATREVFKKMFFAKK